MVLGGISHRLKSPLIVIAGNLTGVRYRDEVLRPVAVPFAVRTKKSEPRPICEKDPSLLPDWKLSGIMCRQTSHTTRAMCTSERKTNVRLTSSQTKLVQSVSQFLGECGDYDCPLEVYTSLSTI
jgi:hypothetical protein